MTFDISIMWCTGQVCVQHQVSLVLELAGATECHRVRALSCLRQQSVLPVFGIASSNAISLECFQRQRMACHPVQAFEVEVRQQLKMPQAAVDAQVAAAQADWDAAQSSDTFDHKLVSLYTN